MTEENTPPTETPVTVAQPPKGSSGSYAVWDHDLGQFVSGVSSKSDADKAKKALKEHNGAITDGHKLETVEV